MTDSDSWAAEIDVDFAELWSKFSGGLNRRAKLDERTRLLVAIGQCVAAGEVDQMAAYVREALSKHLDAREIFEVIAQCCIYVGKPRINRAGRVFVDIARELGLVDTLRSQRPSPPLPETEQRGRWAVPDEAFPRREELISRYGFQSISAGISTQPWHFVRSVEWVDALDQDFARLWLDFIYAGMYSRGVLDDKTRTLVIVGDCVAVEELEQAENHMRNALALGATRDEILEVLLHSTQFTGMPRSFKAIRILLRITSETLAVV
jgi:4-carboxymuconolactone decarboxylase